MYINKISILCAGLALSVAQNTIASDDPSWIVHQMPKTQMIEKENFRLLEKRINEVMPHFVKSEIRKKFELQLLVNGEENAMRIRAEAIQEKGKAIVRVYGGTPRHKTMTLDGLTMIICHELGHHLGGGPRRSELYPWSAAEGQSDYFAGSVCLKRLWDGDDHTVYLLSEAQAGQPERHKQS